MKYVRYIAVLVVLVSLLAVKGIARADIPDPGYICDTQLASSYGDCLARRQYYPEDLCSRLVYDCDQNILHIFSKSWFFIGLGATVAVECAVIGIWTGWKRRTLLFAAGINLLTYTLLNIALVVISAHITTMPAYLFSVVAGEVIVVFVEAELYRAILKWSRKRSYLISLVANISSVLVGLLLAWMIR